MNDHSPMTPAARRKRLGQFFSGLKLGRLLGAIAQGDKACTIIDPMVGSGDLLQACLDLGARPRLVAGIEIDGLAATKSQRRVDSATILHGSAFDPSIVRQLSCRSFDLVIGNPPYVRYQDGAVEKEGIPAASTVRHHLALSLDLMDHLSNYDRELLHAAVASYSGLADLAVPACLLSMAFVSPGGRLALVLPQAWLARNYSQPVRDCLNTMFDVEVIVEDDSASWFPDALVKTSLLVARRRPSQKTANGNEYTHVHLGRGAVDSESLVGEVFPNSKQPEVDFARVLMAGGSFLQKPEVVHLSTSQMLSGNPNKDKDFIDPVLRRISGQLSVQPFRTTTLRELGVSVGQGLRTGANEFFYVKPSPNGRGFIPATVLGGQPVECPEELLRPSVRDQRGGTHAILDLRRIALPEDLPDGHSYYDVMPPSLCIHVRKAAKTLSGKPGRKKPIPELSAVKTNVRSERRGAPPRFWYMLPDFRPRHLPDVYLPRVCANRPRPVLANRNLLVDANFITFRCDGPLSSGALMGILHSNWVWGWLEATGAVMGGGALKIESTMLDRMPIPRLDLQQINQLEVLWRLLCTGRSEKSGGNVDEVIFGSETLSPTYIYELQKLAEARLRSRSKFKI